jgi:HSP20 family protein
MAGRPGPPRGNTGPCPETRNGTRVLPVSKKGEVNSMVRWYYQSVFDELEEMRTYMESLSRQMYDTSPMVLLPGPPGTRLLSAQRTGLRVDIADTGREVVVTADMIPGIAKTDITLTLPGPRTLEISCECRDGSQEEKEGCFLQERRFGYMTRVITLPRPVSEEGSSASFKDGVLEVHLKISEKEKKGKIPVS